MGHDPKLHATALRQLAERVELGEHPEPELTEALATTLGRHPDAAEQLAASEAVPSWQLEELERREHEDQGTERDGDLVMDELMADLRKRRHSA